jgi:hypothetical protein
MASTRFPIRPGPSGAFTMVEFLLAAFILAVGLLGLGALQVATVAGGGGSRTRMAAAALGNNVLERVLAEARLVYQGYGLGGGSAQADPRYTEPGWSEWVERFDRDGLPTAAEAGFFTVTVTRSEPAGLPPSPLATVREFRATVVWAEGAPAAPKSLTLNRLITY